MRITRTSLIAVLLAASVLGSIAGCSSGTQPAPRSSVPTSAPSPASTWLAVLDSAADPNELDVPREDLVHALGQDQAEFILVSPGGCFTGVPQRYGPLYVLAVMDATRPALIERLGVRATGAEWIGAVTSTCLD
jgi:hypothetical protein